MNETLPTLGVTGSSGVLGGIVATALSNAGIEQRLLSRTPSGAPILAGATVVEASYENTVRTRDALSGIGTLFMVSASESADRLDQHRAFIDAAVTAGVKHLVYTSFMGAAPDAVFTLARDHYATEEYIKSSGVAWTFLRDNFYADFMSDMVGDDGAIRGPAGDGRCSIVARADVARTAAVILQDPDKHARQSYDLTGPEALSFPEIAGILSDERLREVRFVNETLDQAYASRADYQAPDWQVDAWVSTYTAIASGALEPVSGDIESITGQAPMGLRALLRSAVS